jgi:hypothetical protein
VTYRILCQGRGFYFAVNPAARPIVVTRRGSSTCQPGGRHPFWRAVALWERQGRRVSAEGLCIWDETRPVRARRGGAASVPRPNEEAVVDAA